MPFNINNTFDADLESLVDQGLVEVQDNGGRAGPARLRQHVPSRKFYRPREGKDSDWVDDSTTSEEEYQRCYILIEVPSVINMGGRWQQKKEGQEIQQGWKVDQGAGEV
jgi:hypothetical protein